MYKMKSDINFSLTHEMLENAENERIHTSYAQEKAILECVSNGDIHALENTYYSLPTTVYGKMTSSNSKLKLLFYASIANTTLVTRYAIEGGLNEETAFSLSDVYIRKMEQCTDVDALMKLNEQMAIEFTLRHLISYSHINQITEIGTIRISWAYVPFQNQPPIINKGKSYNNY